MREVKFRVWDKVMKKMCKPQAISFDIQSSRPFAVSVPGKSWEPVRKYELIQWTGYTDQNGMDVYEGDFVQISSDIFITIWNQSLATFELKKLGSISKCHISAIASGGIVIGNEFQNNDIMALKK